MVPAERRLGRRGLLRAERRSVARRRPGLFRRGKADDGAAGDKCRAIALDGGSDGGRDLLRVVPVHAQRRPTIGFEALKSVVRQGEGGLTVDGDAVVVIEHGELAEAEMPRERGRLVADPLHQVAVGGDHPGAVVHQPVAEARRQQPLGDRHADGVGETLAERAGGGLDRRVLAVLRMARGRRVELPEPLQVLDAHAGMAGQVQQAVEQHGAVPGREHEAVAVRPARVRGIELQEPRPQHRGGIRHAHGHAGMARLRRLHRINGQGAQRVRHAPLLGRGAGEDRGLGGKGGIGRAAGWVSGSRVAIGRRQSPSRAAL